MKSLPFEVFLRACNIYFCFQVRVDPGRLPCTSENIGVRAPRQKGRGGGEYIRGRDALVIKAPRVCPNLGARMSSCVEMSSCVDSYSNDSQRCILHEWCYSDGAVFEATEENSVRHSSRLVKR